MDINEFRLDLQAVLQKVKSIANIKQDIKIIEAKLPKIKLQGTLNKTEVKRELNAKLKSVNPKVKVDADVTAAEKKIRKLGQQKTSPTITPTVDNSQVVSGLKQAQKETKTLWDRFTNGIMGINLIRIGVQEVVQAIRQAIAGIKELDAIKTNIQMVSRTTDSEVNTMMSGYNSMAKELSSTTKEVGEAANEFLRMGESIASTNELIKSSQVLSKVGMIESSEAASYLISSLKGYQVAAQDSMDIVSKLTSVDLEAAVSAGGLAEALSKCANIANNSGVAMDRLIGYTATVGETTQKSMSEVGNSFQALLSRMNNIKIGRFIDDETGESLSDTEAVLNKLGIQLRDTEDSYRSFDAVLDDVGSRWSDFTKVEQNAISVAIAGTRQRENFEALMNNYGNALKYAETAANSAGSALERYGVYQDSIKAKTNELTAAIESLSTNVISEELYSGIIEATTGIVEFIDKANLLKGTLAGLVTVGISKAFVSMTTGIIAATKSTAQLTTAMALFDKGRSVQNLDAIGKVCKGLSDQQLKLILSTKGLEYEDRTLILAGMGVAEAEQKQTLTTLGFASAEDKATASTFSFKGALNSLKTVIAMNPIGTIATAVSAVTIAFSVYKQHQENLRQATEEAANAYKESSKSIDDYASKYQELREALIKAKGDEEETFAIKKQLLELQTELNDKFGDAYGAINLVTEAYRDQTEAIKALNKETAQTFLNENKEGIDKSVKEMTKDRHYNLSYTGLIGNTDKGEALKEIAEKYKEQGITLLDEYGDGTYLQFSIHLNTDAQSAYETINAFENDLRDKAKELGNEHMLDDVLDVSSDSLNKAKETIEKYGDTYRQALTAEIVSDDDKAETYSEALKAVEAYNDAVLRAENPYDDQNVVQAKENLDAIKDSIQGNEEEWGKYSILFDDVFGQADTRLFEFNEALKADSGLKELAENLEGLSDIDLQALDESIGSNDSFDKLKEAAAGYKVNVDELIGALVRLGYVQGEIQGATLNNENLISTFDQAWADSFTSENDAVKELGNSLLELAEQGRLTIETFNNADSTGYFKDLGISADEAVSKINKLADESKQLSSMSNQISSMTEALGAKLEDGFVDADTLSGFDVEVRGLDSWDRFQEILGSTASSYEECQEAANALATEWVNSSDFLAQLTEQNKEYYETQLQAMGVENYEEVIAYAQTLNEAKEVLAQSSLMLGEATQDEIEALIAEGQYSELTANMILALYDAKIAEQAATIDTSADCANLIALAGDTDRTSQSIQLLIQLMDIYSGLESGAYDGNRLLREEALAEVNRIKGELEKLANGENEKLEIEPTVKLGSKGKSSAKSTGKSAGKSYKEGLEEELNDLNSVISGVTGRIDDQIGVIRSQKEAALEAIDAQIDALNEQKSALEAEKKALEDARDAAVEALEEERDLRIEVIEQQKKQLEENIKLIDKQINDKEKVIKGIQAEIDAMKNANDQRKKQQELMRQQYELERLQHQRTILLYSEEKGLHYVNDSKNIRDQKQKVDDAKLEIEIANKQKQIDLVEKEIDLLNEKKDAINEQISLLDEQIDKINEFYDAEIEKTKKYYDEQIKAIDAQIESIDKQIEALQKQREQTEKYYESLIENLENSKSKYEELTEIVEKAELSAALKQLGIDEEALLNGSEEEFNKLKDAYMNIVTQLNSGNDEVLSSLQELSGYDGTAPAVLSDSNTELDEMNGKLDDSNQSVQSVNNSLGETATTTNDVASNVGELESSLSEVNSLVTEEQAAFNNLKQTITEVVEAINQKTQAIQEEQNAVGTATGAEMANFELLKNKILEVKETLDSISNSVTTLDTTPVNSLTTAFQLLYDQLLLVASTLGAGMEGQEEGAVSGITSAIQALNEISLEEGIIAQFDNLKTAIDSVTSAISGGGGESSEGESSSGDSGSKSKSGESGGKSSEGEGGGGNSLTGAITEMGETAKEVIGEPDAEGDGTVIGEFGALETAVNDVTTAIGSGDSEGGDGAIGRFEQFKVPIQEADTHVHGISDGLDEIDGKEVECTIKVNIETSGSTSFTGSAQVLGSMNLNSAEYNAKYTGNAHAEGTALVSGNWAVQSNEQNTLVGEVGRELIVRGGRFFTVGDNGAEMFDIKKGDIVFNHEQTEALLKNGRISGRGKAYADGTVGGGKVLTPDGHILRPIEPGDRAYELQKAFEPLLKKIDNNLDYLTGNVMAEHSRQMEQMINHLNTTNVVNNNKNVQQPVTIQIGDINLTGVQNVNGLARAIKTQFPSAMLQEYSKH